MKVNSENFETYENIEDNPIGPCTVFESEWRKLSIIAVVCIALMVYAAGAYRVYRHAESGKYFVLERPEFTFKMPYMALDEETLLRPTREERNEVQADLDRDKEFNAWFAAWVAKKEKLKP